MDLVELTKKELEKGFTKSELERLWLLPKNSLSAILNPELKATFSKKAVVRVKAYFETDPESRPKPSPTIAKGRKKKEEKKDLPPPPKQEKSETPPKNPPINQSKYDFLNS